MRIAGQIQDFFFNLPESCFAVMISAKSNTNLDLVIPYVMMDYSSCVPKSEIAVQVKVSLP